MFSHSDFPKVLVVNALPFSWTTNSGITMSNLFMGWPSDRLAQIDYSNTKADFDICSNYWLLKKWDILKGCIGNSPLSNIRSIEEIAANCADTLDQDGYESRATVERQLSCLPLKLRIYIGEMIFRLPSVLSPPLLNWIDNFQPDVIFSFTASAPMLRTVVKISQLRDIPILPYFTDDWITTLFKDDFLSLPLRRSLLYWFDECLKRAPVRIANCDAMNEEYTKRYGGQFETFMNLVKYSEEMCSNRFERTRERIRFVYIGSLEPGRWKSLRAIGEALQELETIGIKGELLIYSFPADIEKYGHSLSLEPVMRLMGTARYDDVRKLQQEADVLIHVESFDPSIREYTRYSLSTKIPQYMMVGACIFAYGPEEIASVKYLSDTGAGVTLGEDDPAQLAKLLGQLIQSHSLRNSTRSRAKEIALQRNEIIGQRERFRQTVVRSCEDFKGKQ